MKFRQVAHISIQSTIVVMWFASAWPAPCAGSERSPASTRCGTAGIPECIAACHSVTWITFGSRGLAPRTGSLLSFVLTLAASKRNDERGRRPDGRPDHHEERAHDGWRQLEKITDFHNASTLGPWCLVRPSPRTWHPGDQAPRPKYQVPL